VSSAPSAISGSGDLPAGRQRQVRGRAHHEMRARSQIKPTRDSRWSRQGHSKASKQVQLKAVLTKYQFTAALGQLRTAWAEPIDLERTTSATLDIFDAAYSAAALTVALAGCRAPAGPAAVRQRALHRPGHLAGQARPPRQARRVRHLRRQSPAGHPMQVALCRMRAETGSAGGASGGQMLFAGGL
jgi:hypothetical protein